MKTKLIGILLVLLQVTGCTSMLVSPQPTTMDSQQATSAVTGLNAVDKLIAKGDAQRRRGDYKNAAATLERALRLSPSSGGAFLALARVRLDQGNYAEAQQLAHKSLSLSGDSKRAQNEAWYIISRAKHHLGDKDGARRALQKSQQW